MASRDLALDVAELERTRHRRVNVGSGDYPLNYYVNIDSDPTKPAQVHTHVPPMPCEDESLDEVWCCHFLEHLPFVEAVEFVKECHRCLVPGGRLAIVVPDTWEVMRRYLDQSIDAVEYPAGEWWSVRDLNAICHMFLYSTAQESPHRWSYDGHSLVGLMRSNGFGDLKEIDRYRDPRIAQGAWYQFGFEGRKQ